MIIGTLLTVLLAFGLYALVFTRPIGRLHRLFQDVVILSIWGAGFAIMAMFVWYLTSIFLPVPAPPA